jgi:translocation and assembly module TamB
VNRTRAGIVVGIALAAIVLLFAVTAMVLHSGAFRRYAVTKIVEAAEQATGARVEIQDMNFRWRPLAIEVSGIRALARGASSEVTLANIARVRVTLKPWQLLHREVAIETLSIEKPEIHLEVLPDGALNLPTPHLSGHRASSFGVQIARLNIWGGQIDYQDRRIPLAVDLRGFRAQATFDHAAKVYRGALSYDEGTVTTNSIRPVQHRAEIHFSADAKSCQFESAQISALHSSLSARGSVSNYNSPIVSGDYSGHVSATDLRWIFRNAALPAGEITLQGSVLYRNDPGSRFLNDLHLDGRMQSAVVITPLNGNDLPVEDLQGEYKLDKGVLRVGKLSGNVVGGRLRSDRVAIDLSRNEGDVSLKIEHASLERGSAMFAGSNPMTRRPAGAADIEARAGWKNGFDRFTAQARVDIRPPDRPTSPKLIPLNGRVELEYDGARQSLSFSQSNLSTGQTQLTFSGTVATNSSVKVHLATKDLQEVMVLATSLSTPPSGQKNPPVPNLGGVAEFNGTISGTTKSPRINGQIQGTNVRYENTRISRLQVHVVVDASSLQLTNGKAAVSSKEQLTFEGKAGLANWSLDPEAPLALRAAASNLPVAELQAVAHASYPVEGTLNGNINVGGTTQRLNGQGHVTLVKARVYGESLDALNVDFHAHDRQIELNGEAQAAAGTLNVQGTYDLGSRRYQVKATTDNLKLAQVEMIKTREPSVNGVLSADISGAGTLDDPQGTVKLRIPSLHFSEADLSAIDAEGTLQHGHGEFTVHSVVQNNPIDLKGSVELTDGHPLKATIDTGKMPIGPLLARFVPATARPQSNFAGELEVHANLDGPADTPAKLKARVEIPTLRVKMESFELANEQRVVLAYQDGTIHIENGQFKGTGSTLSVNGDVSLQGSNAMNANVKGSLDLTALQPWTNGGQASGRVNFELQAHGTRNKPDFHGRAQIANALYTSDAIPMGIESLNGEILMDGSRIQLSNVTANAGGGTISIGGSATYGDNTTFNLAVDAKSVRLREEGIHTVVSAKLAWAGSEQSSKLSGTVIVDRLSFTQGSDLAEIASQFSDTSVAAEPPAFERNAKLNVTVQSADSLNVSSNQLSVAGAVNLTATGSVARPVLLGRISLTSGEVFFLGKRFEIQSGTIAFTNSHKTEPTLNLYVLTVVEQYNITINVTGTPDHLRTVYTSDPALATVDIINLLAFGQTTAEAASTSTPASLGAESAVASAVGGQVASQVQKLAGISQLTLNPLAGSNQNPGAQIAIQQRVTGNVLLTFSTNATSAQNQTVQVQYQPKKNVTVSLLRDEYGGYGIDVHYQKAF